MASVMIASVLSRSRENPIAHPPGDAQADLGEAVVFIDDIEQKAHFFVMDLTHSDAYFVRAYPAATAEAWMDGHVHGGGRSLR